MGEAFFWGAVAASTLLIGALVAYWFQPGPRFIMWLAVLGVCALSAGLGYVLLDPESARTGALAQSFAAGALLAMLADPMLPEAYEVEGIFTGSLVVAGFATSIALSAI